MSRTVTAVERHSNRKRFQNKVDLLKNGLKDFSLSNVGYKCHRIYFGDEKSKKVLDIKTDKPTYLESRSKKVS